MDLYSEVCNTNTDSENVSEFTIKSLSWISSEIVKMTFSSGSFFLRTLYLKKLVSADLHIDKVYADTEMQDILQAAEAFSAERQALLFLSRCEQCCYLLSNKLAKKNHSDEAIKTSFDYLQQKEYLSDERFARSWLKNRAIHRFEGKSRLLLELMKRGIERNLATACIEDFFTENSEDSILENALIKYVEKGITEEKIYGRLLRKGFTFKQIQKKLKEHSSNTLIRYED